MIETNESALSIKNLLFRFEHVFGCRTDFGIVAPGRVNIIGEHTDYNGGFVLPAAVDKVITILAGKRSDSMVHIYSETFQEEVSFDLASIGFDKEHSWSNYERGVADVLQKKGYNLKGINILLAGNIPLGSGLSSSAAVEVATAAAFREMCNLDIPDKELALICQKAENEFVGMQCGIMDQFASCLSKINHALFLDCRSLEFEFVPLNMNDVVIVLCNTMVPRQLVSSQYNKRRSECEEGVRLFQQEKPDVKTLRDVTSEMLNNYREKLPPVITKRCTHVVFENERVINSVNALKKGDIPSVGSLMNESHKSLRDNYEVSCKELDIMVEIAGEVQGVAGARMMGGGFGGCTINLVYSSAIQNFQEAIFSQYEVATGYEPQIYVCHAMEGVHKFEI